MKNHVIFISILNLLRGERDGTKAILDSVTHPSLFILPAKMHLGYHPSTLSYTDSPLWLSRKLNSSQFMNFIPRKGDIYIYICSTSFPDDLTFKRQTHYGENKSESPLFTTLDTPLIVLFVPSSEKTVHTVIWSKST